MRGARTILASPSWRFLKLQLFVAIGHVPSSPISIATADYHSVLPHEEQNEKQLVLSQLQTSFTFGGKDIQREVTFFLSLRALQNA